MNNDKKETLFMKCVKDYVRGELKINIDKSEEQKQNPTSEIVKNNSEITRASDEQKNKVNESLIHAMFNADLPWPYDNIGANEYKNIAGIIADRFDMFYYGMIANYEENEDIYEAGDSIVDVVNNLQRKNNKERNAVKVLAAIDMLDGSPDIAKALVETGEVFGIEAAMPYVAAAVVVIAATAGVVNLYNNIIDHQNILHKTYGYSLQAAVEKEKENILEVYDKACDKMMVHICDVHRTRMNFDNATNQLLGAKYAVAKLIQLVAEIDNQYAAEWERA